MFDRALRVPLGRDFNTDQSFRDMTRPKVLTTTGKVVAPLKLDEKMVAGTHDAKGNEKRQRSGDNGDKAKRTKR